jgi:hypothetical protein
MKVLGTFYLNSGVIINELNELDLEVAKDLLEEEIEDKLKEAIQVIKDNILQPCFQKGINGYIEFGDITFRVSDISAAKFEIIG